MKSIRIVFMGFVFLISTLPTYSQTAGNIMVGGGLDLIKSDINGFAEKVQLGFEANYFINRNFGISGGFEIWSGGGNNNSAMVGLRWYPIQKFFLRFRGLIGQDDFGIGGGYSHVLNANWRLEGMADYYLDQGELGLRFGAAYIFRK